MYFYKKNNEIVLSIKTFILFLMDRIVKILKLNIFSGIKDKMGLLLILIVFSSFIPIVLGASPNDACFSGVCHNSSGPSD